MSRTVPSRKPTPLGTIYFASLAGSYVGLINPEGAIVASSASADDDETFTYTATLGGTFVIWVDLYADAGDDEGNDYDMDVAVEPGVTTCADDGAGGCVCEALPR